MSLHAKRHLLKTSRQWLALPVLASALLLGACAQQPPQATSAPNDANVVSYSEYKDPLIGFNRAMFAFNDVTYRYALIPVARGYNTLPSPLRQGVGNFFHNIKMPVRSINYLLQLEMRKTGVDVLRFLVNSTVGVLGIFDPAAAWIELERTDTGFADTISHYGGGYGTYLVLPVLGSSDLRSGTGRIADYFLNPIPYLTQQPETTAIMSVDTLQEVAPSVESYNTLRDKSKDPYLFFRNLYLQGIQRDDDYPEE